MTDRLALRSAKALVGVVAACLATVCDAELRRVTIGTNPAGSNFNTAGGGFAKLLQEELEIPATARPYSGASVYLPQLHRGEITLGINTSNDSFLAYAGEPPFAAPISRLRLLLAGWRMSYMYFVRASSGLNDVEDLQGRRVVSDVRANASLSRLHRAILATSGLTDQDIQPLAAAGLTEMLRMVTEGRADAGGASLGTPLTRQTHTSIPGGLRVLKMGAQEARLGEVLPGAWVETSKPDELNVGVEEPTRVAMFYTHLNTGTHVADEDAYAIVRTIHRNWRALQDDYSMLRAMPSDEVAPVPLTHPYHPGSVRYFREIGLWTDDHDEAQRRLLALHSE